MRKILLILLILISCEIIEDVSGATYYISPTGNNSTGDGSYNNPFASLSHAATVAISGDLIRVLSGTYNDPNRVVLAAGVSILGNITYPVINMSYNGSCIYMSSTEGTNGNQSISYVHFKGTYPTVNNNSAVDIIGRSNVSIHHCKFEDFYKQGVCWYGKGGASSGYPTTYAEGNKFYSNTVTNCACYISGDQAYGNLRIGGQRDMEIYDNTILQEDRGPNLNGFGVKFAARGYNEGLKIYRNNIRVPSFGAGDSWDFAMEIWNSRGGLEIYDNYFQGTVDIGCDSTIDDHIALNDAGGYGFAMKFYNNTCEQPVPNTYSESGIDIERNVTGGTYIFNNYFHNLTYPIRMSMNDYGEKIEDVYIYYNILNGVGTAGSTNGIGMMLPYSPNGTVFEDFGIWNNVIYASPSSTPRSGIRFRVSSGLNIDIRNNIIYGFVNSIHIYQSTITNFSAIKNILYNYSSHSIYYESSVVMNNTSSGNILTNPLFVSVGSNFMVSTGSPAISAGDDVGLDFDYAEMAVSATPTIGAYEYFTASPGVPSVTTTSVTSITGTTASSGGTVTSDGGASVSARGVCWSTSVNPTTSNNKTSDGTGTGSFTSSVTGLVAGTTYYLRAYATNSVGTSYGSSYSFVASDGASPVGGRVFIRGDKLVVQDNNMIIKK